MSASVRSTLTLRALRSGGQDARAPSHPLFALCAQAGTMLALLTLLIQDKLFDLLARDDQQFVLVVEDHP